MRCLGRPMFKDGASLDLKLKSPKIPKKSKKIYRNIFVRTLDKGKTHHLYMSDRLYICSHYMKELSSVHNWIDNNIDKILERSDRLNRVSDYNTSTSSAKKEQQTIIFT